MLFYYNLSRYITIIFSLFLIIRSQTFAQGDLKTYLDELPLSQDSIYHDMLGYLADTDEFNKNPLPLLSKGNMAFVVSCLHTGRFDEALARNKSWIRYADSVGFTEKHEVIYHILGAVYNFKGEQDSSLVYLSQAAEWASINNNLNQSANLQNSVGVIYMDREMHDIALERFRASLAASKALKDTAIYLSVVSNLAETFEELGQLDSTKYYAELGIKLGEITGRKHSTLSCVRALAAYHTKKQNLDKARSLYQEIMEVSKEMDIKRDYNMAILNLASITESDPIALKYADEAAKYWMQTENAFLGAYSLLVNVYERTGKYEEALAVSKVAYARVDSLGKDKVEEQYAQLSAKYDLSEKEKMIALGKEKIAVKDLERSRLWAILFGLLGLGLLSGLVYYFRSRSARENQRLKDQEYSTRLAILETMVLKSQMNPHFIFNSLNSIRFLFMKDQKNQGLKYITKFAKLLRTTLYSGDHVLIDLKDEIDLSELYISLEQLRFDGGCNYGSDFMSSEEWHSVQIPPFTIQPIVENAFWHGLNHKSIVDKNIYISVKSNDSKTVVMIEDSGVGHNNSNVNLDSSVGKKKSYGLNLIRERFELMNKTQEHKYTIEIGKTDRFVTGTRVMINISK